MAQGNCRNDLGLLFLVDLAGSRVEAIPLKLELSERPCRRQVTDTQTLRGEPELDPELDEHSAHHIALLPNGRFSLKNGLK